LCSIAGSLLIAVVVDGWDATLRTPDEVRRFLDLPVLATLSKVDG
jgi:capsular polysaccharide biosynthesis protein